MIRLLKVTITLAIGWSLYWAAAGYWLRNGVATWFDAQAAQGWRADYADLSTSGYPLIFTNTLTSPALADPTTGTAWQADWLRMESPAIWPGRQTLSFADTPQRFSYFDQTAVLEANDMQAELYLHPGVALELERMTLTSANWLVTDGSGDVAGADSLTLSVVQTDHPETYDFDAIANQFTPGDGLRRTTRSMESLPRSFEALELQMQVTFDRTWDRAALENSRPQPRIIGLKLAEMRWGVLSLKAAGDVTVDAAGIPTGMIAVQAENWREMLPMAQSAGAIPARAIGPAEKLLGMLAGLGGNPNTLDIQLNFKDGYIALGPLPLGPAPRIILR